MKVCPKCSFENEENFPTCVWCNTNLAGVASTTSADPGSPEHERWALGRKRSTIWRSQLRGAVTLYTLVITISAAIACLASSMTVLLPVTLFFASGIVVGMSVVRDVTGQFSSLFLQGGISLALFMHFEVLNWVVIFVVALHVFLPALYWHWINLICDANR